MIVRRLVSSVLLAGLAVTLSGCAPEPPITVTQRDSIVGQGVVLTVTNTSDDHLHEVVVDIVSPAGEEKQLVFATLNPHDSVNVGWLKLDGWQIPPGSEVTVSCKDYGSSGPWKVTSPSAS